MRRTLYHEAADSISAEFQKPFVKRSQWMRTLTAIVSVLPAIIMAIAAYPMIQANAKANQKAAYYETIVQNLSMPLLIVDEQGKVILANVAASRLLGEHAGNTLIGKSVAEFMHADGSINTEDIEILRQLVNKNERGEDTVAVVPFFNGDNQRFDANVAVRPIVRSSGRPAYVVAMTPILASNAATQEPDQEAMAPASEDVFEQIAPASLFIE